MKLFEAIINYMKDDWNTDNLSRFRKYIAKVLEQIYFIKTWDPTI